MYPTGTAYLSDNFAEAMTEFMNDSFIGLTVKYYYY